MTVRNEVNLCRNWYSVLGLLTVSLFTMHSVRILIPSDVLATTREGANSRLGDHYLMLINTAIASLMSPDKLQQFDKSPYDGIAIAFLHAYDTSKVPSTQEMDARLLEWKKITKKDVWPWVYINRLLAVDPLDKNPYSKDLYFRNFQGADLDGKAGAQQDFLLVWQNSIRAAKDTGAPGIVFDPEFYNYQNAYDVVLLSQQLGKKPDETIDLLKALGARMADAAAVQYPNAILWFMFTGMGYPEYKVVAGRSYYPSPAYISMGLLDEIKTKQLPLEVISGGEGSLGYCHDSTQQFQDAIRKRSAVFAAHLQKYQGILELGGTMTLWSDRSQKTGWVKDGACGTSSAATVEELQPYLELLLRSYRYNWIYGSADGGYQAFLPQSAARFDTVIKKAQTNSFGQLAH